MTVKQLIQLDLHLESLIESTAEKAGLKNNSVWPIYDGIYSAEDYLNSILKIMWILKEPYDDFKNGKPYGGDWSITKNLFHEPLKYAKASKTGRVVTYTTYGLLHDKEWSQIPTFDQEPSVADCIQQISYVNISKMPAMKQTDDRELMHKYEIWRPVILKQIEVYDPEVIILGNTFPCLEKDLFPDGTPEGDVIDGLVYSYSKDNKLIVWAYHPSARLSEEAYANAIIHAVRKWKKSNR